MTIRVGTVVCIARDAVSLQGLVTRMRSALNSQEHDVGHQKRDERNAASKQLSCLATTSIVRLSGATCIAGTRRFALLLAEAI